MSSTLTELSVDTPAVDDFARLTDPISVQLWCNALQLTYDTQTFRLGQHNIWPVLRQELFSKTARSSADYFNAAFGTPSYGGRIFANEPDTPAGTQLRFSELAPQSSLLEDVHNPPIRKGDSLFIEVPGDYTQFVQGHAVNCFADPLIQVFRHAYPNGGFHKLCRLQHRVVNVPKYVEPSYYIHDGNASFGSESNFLALRKEIQAINRYFRDCGMQMSFDVAALQQTFRTIWRNRTAFLRLFRAIEPEFVFVQNFANNEKFGALMAARELGITTVDIQHGIQENTSMYNNHPSHCASGDYLFPDVLWCWGSVSVEALEREASERPVPWKKVVKGGSPWKRVMETHGHESLRIEKLRRKLPKDKPKILYCHDPALLNSNNVGLLAEEVHQAIVQTRETAFWLMRVHPRASHLASSLVEFCREAGLENIEVDISSRLPIEDMFQVSDIVMSKYSISALEALARRIPVISHSWVGRDTYRYYLDDFPLKICLTAEEIVDSIHDPSWKTFDRSFDYLQPQGVDITCDLEALRL